MHNLLVKTKISFFVACFCRLAGGLEWYVIQRLASMSRHCDLAHGHRKVIVSTSSGTSRRGGRGLGARDCPLAEEMMSGAMILRGRTSRQQHGHVLYRLRASVRRKLVWAIAGAECRCREKRLHVIAGQAARADILVSRRRCLSPLLLPPLTYFLFPSHINHLHQFRVRILKLAALDAVENYTLPNIWCVTTTSSCDRH